MKINTLTIQIHKSSVEVFRFCITPPNSTRWIPHCTGEETNELPVRVGTIYRLLYDDGTASEVAVADMKENDYIEWVSQDKNYHCRYLFKFIDNKTTELEYSEWVNEGEIEAPFSLDVLKQLKKQLE